ncbi:MAG: tetratricopeptide repeat protein [Proteobacteria bacterium]|nr:tetratricopeptide repeat protein [Pseudomonadota bacterium]
MDLEKSKILSKTLADIYLEQGYIEKAIEIYEKLSKREPEDTFYKQRLSSLKKELKEKGKPQGFKKILQKKLW